EGGQVRIALDVEHVLQKEAIFAQRGGVRRHASAPKTAVGPADRQSSAQGSSSRDCLLPTAHRRYWTSSRRFLASASNARALAIAAGAAGLDRNSSSLAMESVSVSIAASMSSRCASRATMRAL